MRKSKKLNALIFLIIVSMLSVNTFVFAADTAPVGTRILVEVHFHCCEGDCPGGANQDNKFGEDVLSQTNWRAKNSWEFGGNNPEPYMIWVKKINDTQWALEDTLFVCPNCGDNTWISYSNMDGALEGAVTQVNVCHAAPTPPPPPALELIVEKVIGESVDPEKLFAFEVYDNSGNMIAQFSLTGGESWSSLDADLELDSAKSYSVRELGDDDDYLSTNGTLLIGGDEYIVAFNIGNVIDNSKKVTVSNTTSDDPPPQYIELTVNKEVVGDGDVTKVFQFEVYDDEDELVASFELKDGESWNSGNLPVDKEYFVRELGDEDAFLTTDGSLLIDGKEYTVSFSVDDEDADHIVVTVYNAFYEPPEEFGLNLIKIGTGNRFVDATFTFVISKLDESEEYVEYATVEITTVNRGGREFIPIDEAGIYKIQETTTGYTTSVTFDGTTTSGTVIEVEYNNQSLVEVTFTNNRSGGGDGGDGGGGGGGGGGTTTTTVPETPVPLAEEPPLEIPEDDVPLADLPQTGMADTITLWLIFLFAAMTLMLTALLGRGSKNNA